MNHKFKVGDRVQICEVVPDDAQDFNGPGWVSEMDETLDCYGTVNIVLGEGTNKSIRVRLDITGDEYLYFAHWLDPIESEPPQIEVQGHATAPEMTPENKPENWATW